MAGDPSIIFVFPSENEHGHETLKLKNSLFTVCRFVDSDVFAFNVKGILRLH